MTIEMRPLADADVPALLQLDAALFGYRVTEGEAAALGVLLELPRAVAAFDGDLLVGSAAALTLELTVPGGALLPMAGVTWVGVRQTHRRRGVMRGLMTSMLEGLRGGPELVAGLGASESVLYRRFGFGPATRGVRHELDTVHGRFRTPLRDEGSIEEVEAAAFLDLLPAVYDRLRRLRPGMITRTGGLHRHIYREAADQTPDGAPMRFVVHRDAGGEVDGFVSFRLRPEWPEELPAFEMRIRELIGEPAAEAVLWRFCLDHALVARVTADHRAPDDPLTDLLADPRRLRQPFVTDRLHLRPIDVAPLLAARRYGREDALVLEVRDEVLPWVGGRFRLEGGLDAASCEPTGAAPDLVLDPAALGAVYLGDVAVERLWRTGLVEERTPGAVRRATAMFAWSPLPWLPYMF